MRKIELLKKSHDRKGFDCGEPELNQFLQHTARQHIQKGISRTFVLVEEAYPSNIIGFFTLSICEIDVDSLPLRWAKKYPSVVPGIKLARLAVSTARQGQGVGKALLIEAMRRASFIANNAGVVGLFVDAKNTSAKAYYEQYGFEAAVKHPQLLFLPLSSFLSS